MPLLTRLSIARSTSKKGEKTHLLASCPHTHTHCLSILATNLPVPRNGSENSQILPEFPSPDHCGIFSSIRELISTGMFRHKSGHVHPRQPPAVFQQNRFIFFRPTNHRTATGMRIKEKENRPSIPSNWEEKAGLSSRWETELEPVKSESQRVFFFAPFAVRAELAMVVCIPDREGGTGCSHEAWRAAGACQP